MGIALLPARELVRDTAATGRRSHVVDARDGAYYAEGHIPGAVHTTWESWCGPAPAHAGAILAQPGYWGLLHDWEPGRYAERLEALGLRDEAPIVVYDGGVASKGRAGRIAWLLLYLGAREVYLLDGGWDAWRKAGGASSDDVAAPARGRFTVRFQEDRRCRIEALRRSWADAGPLLPVDTRSQREFDGLEHDYLPRMGHLPGAALVAFADLFDSGGLYLGRDAYLRRVPAALHAGVPLVTYCECGVRAGTVALLHEIHTGRIVQVYDGSLMEWSLDTTLPVEAAGARP